MIRIARLARMVGGRFNAILVEPLDVTASFGRDSMDTPDPPSPEPLPSNAPEEKNNSLTHFVKDPICEICNRTKIARAVCRRSSQSHLPRATKFDDIITATTKS